MMVNSLLLLWAVIQALISGSQNKPHSTNRQADCVWPTHCSKICPGDVYYYLNTTNGCFNCKCARPPTTVLPIEECGGAFTSPSGTISHPANGTSYQNNQTCVWTITTGKPIKITFISLDIESTHDHLYIRDGNSIDSRFLGNFTTGYRFRLPSIIEAYSGAAYLLFKSDESVTRSGFVLQWETIGCGGECTFSSGIIRHPLRGDTYKDNEYCAWTLSTGNPINIIPITFKLENIFDKLHISDGNSSDSRELGIFSGSNFTSPVMANSGTANLIFKSDYIITSPGFVLQWETLDVIYSSNADKKDLTPEPVCGGVCSFSSGTIRHPSIGGYYQSHEDCVWIIRTANPMNITFTSFSTEDNFDYLYIRNGDTIESSILGNFTGSSIPDPVEANSGAAYIHFTSDFSVTSTGFEIHWEAFGA